MAGNNDPARQLFAPLSQVLWRQRELIDLLAYRLECQQFILMASRTERLAFAVGEVEGVLAEIRKVEDRRLSLVGQAAAALGLPADATLSSIRAAAPAPWDHVLGDHQTELLRLVSRTEELATRNREISQRGLADTQSILAAGQTNVEAYGRHGGRGGLALPPTLVDRSF